MKKRLIPLICAVLLAVLCGCSAEKAVDLNVLRENMTAASTLPEMRSVDSSDSKAERNLTVLTDIAYDRVEEYFIDYADDGSAYELAVIHLKSADDADAVGKDLSAHALRRAEQYRYYQPDQVKNAENALVARNGAYVALIMCDDPAAVKTAFDRCF